MTSTELTASRTLQQAAGYVIAQLRARNLRSHPSRLAEMERLLTRQMSDCGPASITSREFQIKLEACRDIQLLEFVFDQLGDESLDPALRFRVETMLQDSAVPAETATE